MNLKIRAMRNSDIDEVYAIERSVHITPWSKEIVRDCVLVGYDCRVLEFHKENDTSRTILGYIISRYHNRGYHILNFCITKTMQSQGLGKHFLQTIMNSLTKANTVEYVILEVRVTNSIALHLYQGMGFEQVEVKHDYYKDADRNEDAIVLKKALKTLY